MWFLRGSLQEYLKHPFVGCGFADVKSLRLSAGYLSCAVVTSTLQPVRGTAVSGHLAPSTSQPYYPTLYLSWVELATLLDLTKIMGIC